MNVLLQEYKVHKCSIFFQRDVRSRKRCGDEQSPFSLLWQKLIWQNFEIWLWHTYFLPYFCHIFCHVFSHIFCHRLCEKVYHLDTLQQCLPHSFDKSQEINEENSNGKILSIACDKKMPYQLFSGQKNWTRPTTKIKGALPVLLMTFHSGLCKRMRGTRKVIETHSYTLIVFHRLTLLSYDQ